MKASLGPKELLVSLEASRAIDLEAQEKWGFNTYSLIEAAGRSCAQVFTGAFPEIFSGKKSPDKKRVSCAVGTGNNGADAMVMLRYWIISGITDSASSAVVISRMPKKDESGPWVDLLLSLKALEVQILVWDGDIGEAAGRASDDILAHSDIILDGITGTGLKGALNGTALEMALAINAHHRSSILKKIMVVSVDIPSGCMDQWKIGMPIIEADVTLSIEPQKLCIYSPAARPYAGVILPVEGIFPKKIVNRYEGAELLNWESVMNSVPKVPLHAHKNSRGTVEIRAGSPGATGAALISARGAQAAGAGLIRLVADDSIYPILAAGMGGIMVAPVSAETNAFEGRFRPDAILLGPGWGKAKDRLPVLEKALALEKTGTPLILDADAIELAQGSVFSGNAILTPHPGEFSRYTGIERDELLSDPVPVLLKFARDKNAVIVFKGHVITIAAPDGRVGVIDGMLPGLAAGGSGDLCAGFCAAIAARMTQENRAPGGNMGFCAFTCAAAASALLIASDRSLKNRFTDPLELADKAADLAGLAWLSFVEV